MNLVLCVLAFLATLRLVPPVAAATLRRGLFGMDINKKGTAGGEVRVPEAAGLAAGAAFLGAATLHTWLRNGSLHPANAAPSHAALSACAAALLIGFVDDVLDVPWRVKLGLPAFAALPLIVAYSGSTDVVLPRPLAPYFPVALLPPAWVTPPNLLHLGRLYLLYMLAVAVFCTNSINILAGVNGLEAGQALVLSLSCAVHNLERMCFAAATQTVAAHSLSLSFVAPLAAVTAALLCFNAYPSKVFVGDTFTLFAGMTLAVAGTLGHYTETLLLFFAPQIFNFVYSVPQLLKIVPCPRHRLPRLDPATGLLHGSNDYNLLNLVLRVGGPRSEQGVANLLISLQAAVAVATFALRWCLAGVYKL